MGRLVAFWENPPRSHKKFMVNLFFKCEELCYNVHNATILRRFPA